MLLYFCLLPLFISKSICITYRNYFRYIIYLHFLVSCIIFIYTNTNLSLNELLWNPSFGSRFVGFTGSSITLDGIYQLGQTANSSGIFYIICLMYFMNEKKTNLFVIAVCVVGAVLSLSQSTIIVLLTLFIFYFIKEVKALKFKKIISLSMILLLIMILFDNYKIFPFERLIYSLTHLIEYGSIPSSLDERVTQWKVIFNNFNNFYESILIGQLFIKENGIIVPIAESYFLSIAKNYGLVVLVLCSLHYYLFLKFLRNILSKDFLIIWTISLLFLNNTFESDFIIMTTIILGKANLSS